MFLVRLFLLSSLAVAVLPAALFAADLPQPDVIQESWECGSKIDLNPSVTASFSSDFTFEKSDKLPTFMAGVLRDPSGLKFSSVFVDGEMGWHGFAVEGQASFFNAYAAPESGRAVLFSMLSSEGPGQTYTVVSTQDGFKTVVCGKVPAPDTDLGTLDYMNIQTFDLDDKGNGRLTGKVNFSEEKPAECFQSTTNDGGVHWAKPNRITPCVDKVYQEVDRAPDETGPLHDLRTYSSN
jgi:hypothetical protein